MSSRTDIKTTVNRGLAWIAMASSMVWVLDIVGMLIILALWISPREMGIAALVIPFFPALDLFAELGLGAAIVQRDDHTPERISTVFWMNLGMSLLMLGLLSLAVGPGIAALHGHHILASMLGVYGLKLVWSNFYVIPSALMRKQLRFKELSIIRTLSNVGEFAAKIAFAATGFGIWLFVLAPIVRVIIVGIGVQICNPWRPKLVLRIRESIEYAKFGIKASASSIVYHIYTNMDYQVVGYVFTPEATGLYWFAYELVLKPCHLIGQTLNSIAFAAYARLKDVPDKLIEQFVSFTRISLVVMLGFLVAIVISADDILRLIWGANAVPAALAAQLLCGVGVMRGLSLVIPPLLNGLGRPGLSLVYNVFAAVVMPTAFVLSAYLFGDRLGYVAVAYAWVFGYPMAFGLLLYMALKVIELPALEYLRRVIGIPLSCSIAVGAGVVFRLVAVELPAGTRLLVGTLAALTVYLVVLAYWQGISPRSIAAAIRGKPEPEPSA